MSISLVWLPCLSSALPPIVCVVYHLVPPYVLSLTPLLLLLTRYIPIHPDTSRYIPIHNDTGVRSVSTITKKETSCVFCRASIASTLPASMSGSGTTVPAPTAGLMSSLAHLRRVRQPRNAHGARRGTPTPSKPRVGWVGWMRRALGRALMVWSGQQR